MKARLFYGLAILLTLVTTMQIAVDEETFEPILQDMRNNVTDEEYNQVIQTIKEAEGIHLATDYQKIAKYIGLTARSNASALRWNVHVHEGRIRQIGFSTTSKTMREFLVLLNPGKYNLSYTLIGCLNIFCNNPNFFNGGSSPDQFSKYVSDEVKQMVFDAIDEAIIRKGNDIMSNAEVIASNLYNNEPIGIWTVIIGDPSARFGYYTCMHALTPLWFSLRAYKDFKWNYFGTLHAG